MTKHSALKAAALAAAAAAVLAAVARRYRPVRVEGPSMLPTLRPGDLLIVDRRAKPVPGDVVVARHPDGIQIVKRVRSVDRHGVWLAGDNQAMSTDSRRIGPLASDGIAGVAVGRYAPLRRARMGRFPATAEIVSSSSR